MGKNNAATSCTTSCPYYKDTQQVVIACALRCTKAIGYKAYEKGTTKMARSTKKNVEPATTREVREWANANGFEVAARGRIKAEVLEAFTEKTGRPLA